jgi:hypothetical protein
MTWPQLLNGHSEGLITVDCGCHASTRLTNVATVRACATRASATAILCG